MKRNDKKKKAWITAVAAAVALIICGVWYYHSFLKDFSEQQETVSEEKASIPSITEAAFPEPKGWTEQETELPEVTLLYVYLCGCVQKAGVYIVPEGSRLTEVLKLAGGFSDNAAKEYHNLARKVLDEERIYVPSEEEVSMLTMEQKIAGNQGNTSSSETAASPEKNLINLNTADASALMTLPGIGQAKAEAMIEYRTKVGLFSTTEEVMNISGIGEAMFEKIKDYITIQ